MLHCTGRCNQTVFMASICTLLFIWISLAFVFPHDQLFFLVPGIICMMGNINRGHYWQELVHINRPALPWADLSAPHASLLANLQEFANLRLPLVRASTRYSSTVEDESSTDWLITIITTTMPWRWLPHLYIWRRAVMMLVRFPIFRVFFGLQMQCETDGTGSG